MRAIPLAVVLFLATLGCTQSPDVTAPLLGDALPRVHDVSGPWLYRSHQGNAFVLATITQQDSMFVGIGYYGEDLWQDPVYGGYWLVCPDTSHITGKVRGDSIFFSSTDFNQLWFNDLHSGVINGAGQIAGDAVLRNGAPGRRAFWMYRPTHLTSWQVPSAAQAPAARWNETGRPCYFPGQ